jgi:hypothetical protein
MSAAHHSRLPASRATEARRNRARTSPARSSGSDPERRTSQTCAPEHEPRVERVGREGRGRVGPHRDGHSGGEEQPCAGVEPERQARAEAARAGEVREVGGRCGGRLRGGGSGVGCGRVAGGDGVGRVRGGFAGGVGVRSVRPAEERFSILLRDTQGLDHLVERELGRDRRILRGRLDHAELLARGFLGRGLPHRIRLHRSFVLAQDQSSARVAPASLRERRAARQTGAFPRRPECV